MRGLPGQSGGPPFSPRQDRVPAAALSHFIERGEEMSFLNNVITGISLGSIYAIIALDRKSVV